MGGYKLARPPPWTERWLDREADRMSRSGSLSRSGVPTSLLRVPAPIHRFCLRIWIYTHPLGDASTSSHRLPLTNGSYRPSSKDRRRGSGSGAVFGLITSPTSRLPFRLRKRLGSLILLLSAYLLGWSWYQLHYNWAINITYNWRDKNWKPEPYVHVPDPPGLSGCFDAERMRREMPLYNVTRKMEREARRRIESGVHLNQGMSCFDFAGSIQPTPEDYPEPEESSKGNFEAYETHPEILVYHTYWRSDLQRFGPRQEATIRSWLATQHLPLSRLIIWTNGPSTLLPIQSYGLTQLLMSYSDHVRVQQIELSTLTEGTSLHGHEYVTDSAVFDEKAWVDGDVVRLLLLWRYGGVWVDMDEILARDLRLLAGHEFVSQWDCRDDPNLILNGAIMSFHKQSPYLCEAFHIMSTSPPPSRSSLDWGSYLYAKLYHRLIASSIQPFSVIPWCLVDPINCDAETSLPDPFKEDPVEWRGKPWESSGPILGDGGVFQLDGKADMVKRLGQVFSVHLHNRWTAEFPPDGWAERLLTRHQEVLRTLRTDG